MAASSESHPYLSVRLPPFGTGQLESMLVLWYASYVRAGPRERGREKEELRIAMRFGRAARDLVVVVLGLLLLASNAVAAGPAAASLLPQAVSGIHVGIPMDFCYSSTGGTCGSQYAGKLSSLVGKVDLVWGAREPTIGAGVQTYKYVDPTIDSVERGGPPDITTNTAYQYYVDAGEANWMVFQGGFNAHGQRDCSIAPDVFAADGSFDTLKVNENLAWESYTTNNNVGRIPLDIANPNVIASQLQPLEAGLAAGYNGLAVDSIQLANKFGRCGVFNQVNGSWQWTPLYSASHTYAQSVANWLQAVQSAVTSVDPSALLTMNVALPDGRDDSSVLKYANLVFDERGFTNWGGGLATDAAWTQVVQAIQAVQKNGSGILINAEVKAASDAAVPEPAVLWALSNYLLVKSDSTYTYISGLNPSPVFQRYGRFYDRPEYHISIGAPVPYPGQPTDAMFSVPGTACFGRAFSGGLVYVDPSSTQSCSIPLAGPYQLVTGNNGTRVTTAPVRGWLDLAAASGDILLGSLPSSTIVTATAATQVFQRDPKENFGKWPTFSVWSRPNGNHSRSFVQFDLTSMTGTPKSAILSCSATRRTNGPLQIHLASSRWTQTGTSWSHQPYIYPRVIAKVPSPWPGKALSADVLWAPKPGRTLSLAIVGGGNQRFSCDSIGTKSPPTLTLTF